MERRTLGRTNLSVSVVGFGGIPLQRINQESATALIRRAGELGINFIDTARGYTISEELIGHGIYGEREKWILATKSTARSYDDMKKDIDISLSNLQTEYIDLYQLHLVRTEEQYREVMGEEGAYKALLEAKNQGKIGYIGFTTHDVGMLEKAVDSGAFDTIQFPYNIIESQAEEIFRKAKEKNIGVIVMKPLAGGAIGDASLALRHVIGNRNISTAIPGMDRIGQVEENAHIGKQFVALNEEEKTRILEIAQELGQSFCRRCGYCGPCPQGIDIPTQFILEGYFSRYELQDWAKERYGLLAKKAGDCIKCGACEPKCPYDLPIRSMLEKAHENLS